MNDHIVFEVPPVDNLAINLEPRCPCLLLLDTSYSMKGKPITELNKGLISFKQSLENDSLAKKRVEIAVITFGPVNIENSFCECTDFSPPKLTASGVTPMEEAIEEGLELLKQRVNDYKNSGIAFYRPWVFLITDGEPTNSRGELTNNWSTARELIGNGERNGEFSFFCVGVENANMDFLRNISVARDPVKLKGLSFEELFLWVSASMKSVSASSPRDPVTLPSPKGWAVIE